MKNTHKNRRGKNGATPTKQRVMSEASPHQRQTKRKKGTVETNDTKTWDTLIHSLLCETTLEKGIERPREQQTKKNGGGGGRTQSTGPKSNKKPTLQLMGGTKLQFPQNKYAHATRDRDVPSAHLLRKDTQQRMRRRLLSDIF